MLTTTAIQAGRFIGSRRRDVGQCQARAPPYTGIAGAAHGRELQRRGWSIEQLGPRRQQIQLVRIRPHELHTAHSRSAKTTAAAAAAASGRRLHTAPLSLFLRTRRDVRALVIERRTESVLALRRNTAPQVRDVVATAAGDGRLLWVRQQDSSRSFESPRAVATGLPSPVAVTMSRNW